MNSRKKHLSGDRDRINSLPEDIITRIISLLPTKDAVRTSVLSKAWEYKWTSSYNVNFDHRFHSSKSLTNKADFPNFVERASLHSHNIRSFYLFSEEVFEYDATRMATWMSVIFRRNIESFTLICHCAEERIVLPRSLGDCMSLRTLELVFPCIFRAPLHSFFPNLTNLRLENIHIMNQNSRTDTLLFTFPVLKCLDLLECKCLNVKILEFSVPALIDFRSARYSDEGDYYIKLLGDRIENLEIYGGYHGNCLLIGTTVLHASLSCTHPNASGLDVRKGLKEYSGLNHLTLIDCLYEMSLSKQGLPLPRYDQLERLELFDDDTYAETLLEILQATPFLRFLVLTPGIADEDFYGSVKYDCVPTCIVSHLEIVTFDPELNGYTMTSLYSLAKFFLKYGSMLKGLCIRNVSEDALITEQLLSFPKASSSLKIRWLLEDEK